jgi:hypothetical protein
MDKSWPVKIRILASVAFSFGVGAWSASGQGVFDDRGSRFSFGHVEFPSVIDTFAVMQTIRYPDPSLGVALQYRTPLDRTARLDLYVYPVRAAPDTNVVRVVKAEFDLAWRQIMEYAARNPQAFEVVREEHERVTIVDASGVSREGWQAEAEVTERGVEQTSFLYIFVKGDSYLKYRIAYAAALDSIMRPRVAAFVSQTLDLVSVVPRGGR